VFRIVGSGGGALTLVFLKKGKKHTIIASGSCQGTTIRSIILLSFTA